MAKRFIAGAEPLDKQQQTVFLGRIREQSGTWWHWISGMWLLHFPDEADVDAEKIWGWLSDANPQARIIVTEAQVNFWVSSDIANNSGKKMDTWLQLYWSEE